ncbi:MAG: amidohydrolase family protein [Saprospiraceae bacterium]
MKLYSILFLLFITIQLQAQQTPAAPQSENILIMGAKAHLGNGEVIENSAIAFENGKLTIVADATTVRIDPSNYKVIEANGKHVYPGFIAPNTQLGLTEISAVRATRDADEVGALNPNMRSIIAYNTDSDVTPTVRSNGVLLAQIVPVGGRISGQSTITNLDAWNWEDAAYKMDEGIHVNWPVMFRYTGWWAEPGEIKKNDKYIEQKKEIETLFKEAQAYAKKKKSEKANLKLESMKGLFDKSKTLYVHTQDVKTMTEVILFAESFDVRLVLVGARESWMIMDLIKEKNISIVLDQVQSLPSRADEDIDQPFKTPALLKDAGVPFCFSMDGFWQQRNLAFQAGQAIGYGLDYEDAVAALSLETAKILNIDKTTGSLESGKDATLFISEGDALDMRTCKVTTAFIQGRMIDLDNKQKELYRKYKKRYEENGK